MKFDGKVALISGGASGLGEATAERFLAAGARVAIIDRDAALAQAMADRHGGRLIHFALDVADDVACAAAVERTVAHFGALHVCVNAAGIGGYGPTLDAEGHPLPLTEFRRLLETNTIGTFNVARLCAAAMARNAPEADSGERGVIINVASITGFEGGEGAIAYATSKAAVVGMTLPMCRDLASRGIRVCAIAAGIFETPLLATLPPGVHDYLVSTVEFPRRGGRPQEFAALAAHIVDNPYLNGEVIRLDGGTRGVAR